MFLPVAEIFVTKEARNVVLRSWVGVPVEASVGKCLRGSFVRFRMRPLDTESEGFGGGSLWYFSCQLERLIPLRRTKHWVCHRSVVVAVVGQAGGWLDLNASAVDHGPMKRGKVEECQPTSASNSYNQNAQTDDNLRPQRIQTVSLNHRDRRAFFL